LQCNTESLFNMFNYEIGTPCPAPAHGGREVASPFGSKQNNIFDDAFDQFNDNTTQNIAHLVQQEFKNAPPRRTQNLARKPRRAPTTIFEDAGTNSQREPYRRDEPAGMMRSSAIHARPAQRIRIQTSREEKPATLPTSSSSDIANFKPTISTNKPVNEDRRRTIWIPEDTTLLSIHPGAYDHTLRDETVGLPSSQLDISPMKETPQPVRMGASAMRQAQKMASTSKRSALRPLAPSQPNVSNSVMGTGGGKENVLPGALLSRTAKGEKPLVKPMSKAAPLGTSRSQSSLQQTMSVKKRPAPELKDAPKPKARALHERASVRNEVLPRPANLDPFSRDFKHKPLPAPKQAASKPPSARPVSQNFAPKDVNTRPVSSTIPPRDVSLPNLKRSAFLAASRYPVLSDDLGQPELYEDNWLQNQEVALTQLVNVVFQQAHESSAANDVAALRSRMLTLYHDASVATLHQRLKASLSYGALSMPKDSSQSPKLRDDIGLRRQFFDLFGHTYDSEALQAAAEVVVGRVITPAADHTRSRVTASSSTGIKEWKRFCSTFFVDHEDSAELLTAHDVKSSEGSTTQPGTPEWFWQRTVLRGLMLIHLLDQVKSTGKLSTCLFQASSPHKSSISVLRAFAKLMVPSVGDISRSLGHLGYSVRHVQQPLEEYTYRIDNLAVDLRDGVLLAHFVELLLYPSRNLDDRSDRTITFDLPDGETLTSFLDSNSTTQILSQHLKFPCNSKVQKMHNVQVALSALTGARGLAGTAIETIKAEDIVNGHREKTLSLLWALVSRWGLGYLVDWDELKKETLRFSKFSTQPVGINYALSAEQPDTNEQGPLLKEWAASVCQQHKVIVTNLTTSFADGRALAAIISTYADYVPASTKKSSNKMSTADRLRNLGCSESFITLFASQATTIPSRSNTIALLAFLSSRLLPLARTHRAACAIQNAYRLRLARRNISLRIQKMRAATDCAAVAANKQREVDAAVTLQRAWRAVLDRRIECLERDVLAFQSMARGWAVRRATAGVLGTGSGRRVMGGW
jgi:abnormal spindle-like microcephaly-associated protein